ncbi:MAG: cytochrome c [Minicystis sp.]
MRHSILLAAALLLAACVSAKTTPLAEIPGLTKLDDVMDNQATASDPQFKKIGQAKFDDAELAALAQAAERIQATSLKTKEFSKSQKDAAGFEALATKLNEKAKALGTAAGAKDAKAISAALEEMRATCRECHSKYR